MPDLTLTMEFGDEEDFPKTRKGLEYLADTLSRQVRREPDNCRVRCKHALVLEKLGRHAQAIREYSVAIEQYPEVAVPYAARAYSNAAAGDYKTALEDVEMALNLDFDHDYVFGVQGFSLMMLGRLDEAISAFGNALLRNPDNNKLHMLHGKALVMKGSYELARKTFTNVIHKDPSGEAYELRAQAYIALGDVEKSLDDVKMALSLGANSGTVYLLQGDLLYMLGRDDEAVVSLQQAIEMMPNDTRPCISLANVYHESAVDEAARWYTKTLDVIRSKKDSERTKTDYGCAAAAESALRKLGIPVQTDFTNEGIVRGIVTREYMELMIKSFGID